MECNYWHVTASSSFGSQLDYTGNVGDYRLVGGIYQGEVLDGLWSGLLVREENNILFRADTTKILLM